MAQAKDQNNLSVIRLWASELGPGRGAGQPVDAGSPLDQELLVIETVGEAKPLTTVISGNLKAFADRVVRAVYGPDASVHTSDRYIIDVYTQDAPGLIYVWRYGHGHTNLGVDTPDHHRSLSGAERALALALVENAYAELLPEGFEPRLFRKG